MPPKLFENSGLTDSGAHVTVMPLHVLLIPRELVQERIAELKLLPHDSEELNEARRRLTAVGHQLSTAKQR